MREPVSDDLWRQIEPILPPEPPKPRGGRPRVPDREALTGILFVLRTGIAWEHLPKWFGCGSGMTCWRRLREWQRAGVWPRIRHILERELDERGVDWTRAWVRAARTRPGRRVTRHAPEPIGATHRSAPQL